METSLNRPIMEQPEHRSLSRKRMKRKLLHLLQQENVDNAEAVRDRIMMMVDKHVNSMVSRRR